MSGSISIKEFIMVGGVVATLAGFYFSTGYRLNALEAQAADVEDNSDILITVSHRLSTIDAELKEINKDLDKLEDMLKRRK